MAITTTAVILARGLGSRMRQADSDAELDQAQAAAAELGLKTMIPDARGRPFLAHILSGLADVGIDHVVLVVAPAHEEITAYFRDHPTTRLRLSMAVQAEADGTAGAVLAARAAVGDGPFWVLNADNLYPESALRALRALVGQGLIGFSRDGLISGGGIDPERVRAFALLAVNDAGELSGLVEKPSPATFAQLPDAPVSMNLWQFDARIFAACAAVPRSERGEFELPQAVEFARRAGEHFQVIPVMAPVLDLSRRGDVAQVAALLADRPVHP